MKRCPFCQRTYADTSLNFCLEDGTPLTSDAAPGPDPNATVRYPGPRSTSPPPTEIYHQGPLLNQVDASAQPRRGSPLSPAPPRKKSNAIWWVLGGVLVLAVLVIGAAIMILALASMGTNINGNANVNTNSRNANSRANRNSNTPPANTANANANANLPRLIADDFSESKWGTGTFTYGDIWYYNGEYHMRAKDKSYLVMYAPSPDYNTGDATVRVTARSVDGNPSSSGFGLIVHGDKSSGALEDYALLIYTGSEPKYEIIKHKNGTQSTVVPWTDSRVIRSGTSPNQLEVRARGTELTFYINGQYIDRITDSENFRRGVAGVYTSGASEVAFDDLEVRR